MNIIEEFKTGNALHLGKSKKYKNVYIYKLSNNQIIFKANTGHRSKAFTEERLAALFVDKYLISINKPPVNILKPLAK